MQFILVFNSSEDSSTPIHLLQLSYKVVQYTVEIYRTRKIISDSIKAFGTLFQIILNLILSLYWLLAAVEDEIAFQEAKRLQ